MAYPDYGTMTSGRFGPLSRLEANISGTYGEGDLGEQGYTATLDGDRVRYFKDGLEVDPPEEIKEAFMSADDEDISVFGDAGGKGFDIEKFTDILGDAVGAGKATPFRPVKGATAPAMPRMPQGSTSYRPTQSPYQVPSYLMSSAQYNEQISKMLGGLLARSIRSNPIKYLV